MDPRRLIDDGLELTVLGSFSSLGIAARRRIYGWNGPAHDALAGRTALITGPTSGLGRRAAERLAAIGARVVLVGRSQKKLDELSADLRASHGEDRFPTQVADMGSLRSIRDVVGRIVASEERLDVLIDNAGAIFPERTEGPDGIEATLALLVVGPFALVGGLLPVLRRTRGSRVICVSSGGMYTQAVALDDLEWEREPYSGTRAYARAKRIQVMLVREWARRLGSVGPTVHAMHPGWADTPGLSASLPGFQRFMRPILRSADEGIDSLIWLAAARDVHEVHGAFVHDRRGRPFDRAPFTRLSAAERRRLWAAVVERSGMPDPVPER